jgi:hypothetical protein
MVYMMAAFILGAYRSDINSLAPTLQVLQWSASPAGQASWSWALVRQRADTRLALAAIQDVRAESTRVRRAAASPVRAGSPVRSRSAGLLQPGAKRGERVLLGPRGHRGASVQTQSQDSPETSRRMG